MEPAAVCLAPSPLPVAWLQGDVLAEYLRFLEEAPAAPSPPPARVPVAWLEGEAREEFLRFLEESRAVAAAADPDRQVRDSGGDAVDGYDDVGIVVDDDDDIRFVDDSGAFMDDDGDVVGDDASAMGEDDDEGEDGSTGDDDQETEEEAEAVLELLLPHILDLPAFAARAAAPPPEPQELALGSPHHQGGWLQRGVFVIEADSCSSDEEMSSVEEEIQDGAIACSQQMPGDSSFRHSCIF